MFTWKLTWVLLFLCINAELFRLIVPFGVVGTDNDCGAICSSPQQLFCLDNTSRGAMAVDVEVDAVPAVVPCTWLRVANVTDVRRSRILRASLNRRMFGLRLMSLRSTWIMISCCTSELQKQYIDDMARPYEHNYKELKLKSHLNYNRKHDSEVLMNHQFNFL